MKIYAKKLLVNGSFENNKTLTVTDGIITDISDDSSDADYTTEILTAGLFDQHCHGGEGFCARDFNSTGIENFLEKMLSHGITDFLMTISTASRELMRHALKLTRDAMERQASGKLGGARICGVHLEGPFLSQGGAGAMQKSAMLLPSAKAFKEYFDGYFDIIKLVTLAPENEGTQELICYLKDNGINVQAGHSVATYDEAVRGFNAGIGSLCHTFNGCRGIHHREPGIVTAALSDDNIYTEAICDLVHLHPAIIKMIYKLKGSERMIAISDSTITNGLPNGEYFQEGYHIIVKDGVSRTADGALDGGGVYLDGSVRNLVKIGIPSEVAFCMASKTPTKRLGLTNIGDIALGTPAHLVGWNEELFPAFSIIGNEILLFK